MFLLHKYKVSSNKTPKSKPTTTKKVTINILAEYSAHMPILFQSLTALIAQSNACRYQ